MLTDVQLAAAGLLARGYSQRAVARRMHRSPATTRAWGALPEFAAEHERVLSRGGRPDPEGTLLDALGARKDDGVDWPSRVRAAYLLMEKWGDLQQPDEKDAEAAGVAEGW